MCKTLLVLLIFNVFYHRNYHILISCALSDDYIIPIPASYVLPKFCSFISYNKFFLFFFFFCLVQRTPKKWTSLRQHRKTAEESITEMESSPQTQRRTNWAVYQHFSTASDSPTPLLVKVMIVIIFSSIHANYCTKKNMFDEHNRTVHNDC